MHQLTPLFSTFFFFFFPASRAKPFVPEHQPYLSENASFLSQSSLPIPTVMSILSAPAPSLFMFTQIPEWLTTQPDLLNGIVDDAAIHNL